MVSTDTFGALSSSSPLGLSPVLTKLGSDWLSERATESTSSGWPRRTKPKITAAMATAGKIEKKP